MKAPPDKLSASLASATIDDRQPTKKSREEFVESVRARYRIASDPLIRDLQVLFPDIDSPWNLAGRKGGYPEAIPVLLKHLVGHYPPNTREGLIHALNRKWAREQVWEPVLSAYRAEPNLARRAMPGEIGSPSGPKDAMASLLADLSKRTDLDVLTELICDSRHGPSRVFFVAALMRMRSETALATLGRISNDPDLKNEIEYRLKARLRRESKKLDPRQAN